MFKKIFVFCVCIFLQFSTAQAATQLKVSALDEFRTERPSESLKVLVLDETQLGSYLLSQDTILNCQLVNIVEPKRGKRNASFYVRPISYVKDGETINISEEMYGKYSIKRLSKEELKKLKPIKVAKHAALMVGDYFMQGVSIVYNFTEGLVKNEKDNRVKSGVVNAYEGSALSYISEGEQLNIKKGDIFYFIFKLKNEDKDSDEDRVEDKTSEFINE